MDYITNRWRCLGLLDNVDTNRKTFVANKYESTLEIIVNSNNFDDKILKLLFQIIANIGNRIDFSDSDLVEIIDDCFKLSNNYGYFNDDEYSKNKIIKLQNKNK